MSRYKQLPASSLSDSFTAYVAHCATSAQANTRPLTDEEHIPYWITDDLRHLREMVSLLREAPIPPTDQTYRAVLYLEGPRLEALGFGMRQAGMVGDETITDYMRRIGIPEHLIASTMANREHLKREISAYWDKAVELEVK